MRSYRRIAVTTGLAAAVLSLAAAGSLAIPAASATGNNASGNSASASSAKARYTNATEVKADNCPVHWNYPKSGLPDRTWPAGRATASKDVGVRYTAGSYALVLDFSRAPDAHHKGGTFPWWGWISKSCLVDPVARKFPDGTTTKQDKRSVPDADSFATPLGDREGVGGNNIPKTVDMTPAHHGKPDKVLHLGSGGTLRSGPKQFAIGNLDKGWEFRITRAKCRTEAGKPYDDNQWVFGYAPQAGRWGWVQAHHLPACTA
jgi:hypothetical protein